MILTEQEAKEKWCPQGHYHKEDYAKETATPKCAASGCMMWRWYNTEEVEYMGFTTYPILNITKLSKDQWTGYCGLAGKP